MAGLEAGREVEMGKVVEVTVVVEKEGEGSGEHQTPAPRTN